MNSREDKAAAHWLMETQKGYLRIVVLILLNRKPHYGYEMMKEIKERTMGFWRPTPGGIYPILQNLEKSEYIQGEWNSQMRRKRKTYAITKAGEVVLERALAKESQIAESMSGLLGEFMKDVLDVEMNAFSMPRRPPFFSVFLEEGAKQPEDMIKVLEGRREQIENMITELQKGLGTIEKRLVQLEQPRSKQNTPRLSDKRR
jgi:DNA-binding PadR family transcriptional regulator